MSIVDDFTDTPGLRFRSEGSYSGQEFREDILEKKFKQALNENVHLEVNLDGTFGYATPFLEEAFGGLARIYGVDLVKSSIILISKEDLGLNDKIYDYIVNCQKRKKKKI